MEMLGGLISITEGSRCKIPHFSEYFIKRILAIGLEVEGNE